MLKKIYKYKDNDNNNILHLLINSNDQSKIKKILEKGLKYGYLKHIINEQNNEGDTPLHLSVRNKNNTLASLLIDYGADKTMINCQGQCVMRGGSSIIYKGVRYL